MKNATGAAWKWTEISASSEVVRCIRCCLSAEGRRKQIWISRGRELGCGTKGVTPVAIPLRVDNVTTQSNQRWILSNKIQRHRGYRKALLNLQSIFVSLVVIILCTHLRGADKHHSRQCDGD